MRAWHSEQLRRDFGVPAVALLILIGAALLLKLLYSGAPDDEPRWLLGATARLFSIASGIAFQFEAGRGYLSADGRLLLYRGCSGLNVFVMAMLFVGVVPLALRFERALIARRHSDERIGDLNTAAVSNSFTHSFTQSIASSALKWFAYYPPALAAAYAVTLLANTGRMLALLATARIAPEALHPGALHMAVGSFVYLVFLILFYSALRLIFERIEPER